MIESVAPNTDIEPRLVCGIGPALALLADTTQGVESALFLRGGRGERFESVVQLARQRGIKIRFVERASLDRASAGVVHQGVVLVAALQLQPTWELFLETLQQQLVQNDRSPVLVVLDGIEDPRNLGAILRSAHAFGAVAVIRTKDRAAPLNAAAEKSASGAAAYIPCVTVTNLARALDQLAALGVRLCGLAADATESLIAADLTGPLALLLGGEANGLRRLTRQRCHILLSIPMEAGEIGSLNVAVAASVALYEVARQRMLSK
ncbi:MAG: 23S rRNA (guanosine(2251)-2'-O)-methyltransferase RlmB [Magnetococcales bacterium]|nr:23S rRNA (guanosine(2251)-2'-O)-methyltransferase RlmB [Magnetococcales bacterium]